MIKTLCGHFRESILDILLQCEDYEHNNFVQYLIGNELWEENFRALDFDQNLFYDGELVMRYI